MSQNIEIKGYFDKKESTSNPFDICFMGSEESTDFAAKVGNVACFPAIGNNLIRKKLIALLDKSKIEQLVLIHKNAVVNCLVKIEVSTIINSGAVINPLTVIGKGCVINTNATIEHDCAIGNYSHIAPGVVLLGNVKIGENCFIGANTVIKQGLNITKDVIIGAGSVVLENINESGTWVGNPAKRIK